MLTWILLIVTELMATLLLQEISFINIFRIEVILAAEGQLLTEEICK